MFDDDADRARVLGEFLDELHRERAFATDLAADLESTQALLSEALTVIERQTQRIKQQADRIRELMGLVREWHAPIRLVDEPDVEIPPALVRAFQIRWTPFHGG